GKRDCSPRRRVQTLRTNLVCQSTSICPYLPASPSTSSGATESLGSSQAVRVVLSRLAIRKTDGLITSTGSLIHGRVFMNRRRRAAAYLDSGLLCHWCDHSWSFSQMSRSPLVSMRKLILLSSIGHACAAIRWAACQQATSNTQSGPSGWPPTWVTSAARCRIAGRIWLMVSASLLEYRKLMVSGSVPRMACSQMVIASLTSSILSAALATRVRGGWFLLRGYRLTRVPVAARNAVASAAYGRFPFEPVICRYRARSSSQSACAS